MKNQITHLVARKLRYLILTLICALTVSGSFATHFRYGNLTWSRVPGSATKIRFKISTVLRYSFYTNTSGNPVHVGASITLTNFNPGFGGNQLINVVVTSVNMAEDWFQGEYSWVVNYPAPGNYVAQTPTFCCRIITPPLVNNPGNLSTLSHIFPTLVQVGPGYNNNNDAPVSTVQPQINFTEHTHVINYQFPAVDPNGDALTYSLSPNGTFGSNSQQPAGLSITSSGVLTWSTDTISAGKYYYASVRITDAKGAYTTTDFLIKIVGQSAPPTFDSTSVPNGTEIALQPGDSIALKFKTVDLDCDTTKLTALGMPAGSSFIDSFLTGKIRTGLFTWTPADSQQGTYLINVTAEDCIGVQSSTTFSLDVSYKPRFDVPLMPGNNSVFVIKPGDTLKHLVRVYHPTSTDGVVLTQTSAPDVGMTYSPAFPLTVGNPVVTQFSWAPTISQWGLHKMTYQAQDTFYKQKAFDTTYYIVDNPPFITSTPILYGYVGRLYNYLLTSTDADIPYGDRTKVENISKPNFLNVTDNSNATFNIAGIPGNSDIGTHPIGIEVSDSFNHYGGTHAGNAMQYYNLVVVQALDITGTVTDVTINRLSNGAINASVTGGVGPYTYHWSNNASTEDISSVPAGTYTLVVTDSNGVSDSAVFTVKQPDPLIVPGVVTHVGIYGQSTGAVDITPAGGVGPYSYSWNNSATTEDISSVPAATYTVTVTDANGATATNSFVVNQPAKLVISGTPTNVTIYGTNNGAITTTTTGGVGGYTYTWSDGPATTANRTSLYAGTYTVTVTDANGATANATIVVTEPAKLVISGTPTNVTIYGINNGAITTTTTGGVGGYTYTWSDGPATTANRTSLYAGTYTVTVKDANGATANTTIVVTEPAKLVITGTATDVTIYGGNNGTATTTTTGGVGPYIYSWTNNSGTTANLTGLTAGTYTATVTDANGATASTTLTVNQPAKLTITGVTTNVTTYGGSNGTITTTTAGGVGPYTYSWVGGATTANRTGLTAGTYTVTVTDANGATATASFVITQPSAQIFPVVSTCTFPYIITLESVNLVNGKYEWIWSIRNPNPGNGKSNGTVQDLSHWDITLGACAKFESIVSGATSSNGTSWSSFTPTYQQDPSIYNTASMSTGNVIKFNVTTTGTAKTYCKLVTTQNLTVNNQSVAYYKSGTNTGSGTICFPGFGCAQSGSKGLNEQQDEQAADMTVYPNPNNGSFTVDIPAINANGTIIVRDITGKLIRQMNVDASDEKQSMQINLIDAKGLYIVEIAGSGYHYISRVIVQ